MKLFDILRVLLFGPRHRALTFQLAALLVTAAALTVYVDRAGPTDPSPAGRAAAEQRRGDLAGAERALWEGLTRGPVTVPLLVAFLDNHHHQKVLSDAGLRPAGFVVPEGDVDALLTRADLPGDVATLGAFWRGALVKAVPRELRDRTVALAGREPPAPFANRLLGLEARREGKLVEAAAHLEREGLRFPERQDDFDLAMRILALAEAWDEIGQRLARPDVAPRVPPSIRYSYAVRSKDARAAVKAIVAVTLEPRPKGALAMAAVAGVMWLLFVFRLGKVGEAPRRRVPLYLAAFALGVVSVIPTLIIVGIEDSLLAFRERGELVSDIIFFTVGVGLREELSKLLLFLPLLPWLLRRGDRLEVVAVGALVGLGFAAEENVQYLHHGGLTTALARFLTANFLHMALTGLLALAAYDFARAGDEGTRSFSRTLLIVIGIHGAYDFFLTSQELGGLGFFAMATFIVLTRIFLREVRFAAKGPIAGLRLRFAQAVCVVAAASFVYAASFVGPWGAAFVVAQGFLGLVVIVIMFAQEMRRSL